ncbi:hypothetical protein CI610_00853 [invertebrate metagenome]|uniref:Cytochrome oxidase maturation protein cbb3-type n=1 Tax=invertebrate metagenome TaxID=1711999 RepID=A0A2H9TA76_9ZZZZ
MKSLALLIPIAFFFVVIALLIFFWAVNRGQFDDLEGPAHSILHEEDHTKHSVVKNNKRQD